MRVYIVVCFSLGFLVCHWIVDVCSCCLFAPGPDCGSGGEAFRVRFLM